MQGRGWGKTAGHLYSQGPTAQLWRLEAGEAQRQTEVRNCGSFLL